MDLHVLAVPKPCIEIVVLQSFSGFVIFRSKAQHDPIKPSHTFGRVTIFVCPVELSVVCDLRQEIKRLTFRDVHVFQNE